MRETSLIVFVLLFSALTLVGCSSAGTTQNHGLDARYPSASEQLHSSEKYQDCLRDVLGDVFAERTCEVYLSKATDHESDSHQPEE